MSAPVTVAAVVLTHDEERHIADCLATLAWAGRRVVFDSFSQDQTVARARAAGAEVLQHAFENYAQQRNAALEAVEAEWVLFVDADERVPAALAAEVRAVTGAAPAPATGAPAGAPVAPGGGAGGPEAGWWIPRDNLIFGRLTRGAGWSPDYQLRLLHRGHARYDPARAVHELAVLDGPAGYLRTPLLHYNYDTLRQFIAKQERYTDYEAGILFQRGVRPRLHQYLTRPWRHFWWRFVTLRGYVDGWHGLRLSALMAYYQGQLMVRLGRHWRAPGAGRRAPGQDPR